jgi:hypothetical protein
MPTGSPQEQMFQFGAAANLFPIGPDRPLRTRDIPSIQIGLDLQNREHALMDQARGIEALNYARGGIGESPEVALSRELAAGFATGQTGPYSDAEIASRRAGLIAGQRDATEAGKRDLGASFAQRNISGAAPALELALLERAGRSSTAQALGDFDARVAGERQAAREAGLGQLSQLGVYGETAETDLLRAISEAHLNREREPFDLSGLMEQVPDGGDIVGGRGDFIEVPPLPWARYEEQEDWEAKRARARRTLGG